MSGPSERYGVTDHEVDIERVRLSMLAGTLDPGTFRLLERVGVGPTSIATIGRKPASIVSEGLP